jgi:hypothetical protein
LLLMAGRTWLRNEDWRSEESLYKTGLEVRQRSWRSWAGRAFAVPRGV